MPELTTRPSRDTVGLTPEDRQRLRVMLGPQQSVPKTALLFQFAEAIRDIREHPQTGALTENLFAANLHGWMGERARWLLAYLLEVDEERALAVAHDRQPYPTAHAYEMACAALQRHRERADAAEADRMHLANMLCAALGVISSIPEIPAELQAEVQGIRNGSHGHVCDVDPDEAGVPA